MNTAQALSPRDRDLLVILAGYGTDLTPMACEFSRQYGAGTGKFKGPMQSFGDATYRIEYDLMLCTYCGNLLPQQPCCPAKFQRFKDWLIGEYLAAQPTPPQLTP